MRTVTFSTPEIQSVLKQHFVPLYTNTSGDATAGESFKHAPGDPAGSCIRGNGEQNVQVIVLTPDLKIIHALCGYIDADDLYAELEFASKLFEELKKEPGSAEETVCNAHRQRLRNAGFDDSHIDASNDFELMQAMFSGQTPTTTGSGGGVFDGFVRQRVLKDGRFCIHHPLMDSSQLESDPGELVGRGQTFFGTSSSGTMPDMNSFLNPGMSGQFPPPGQPRRKR
jgi:hypothetical protein